MNSRMFALEKCIYRAVKRVNNMCFISSRQYSDSGPVAPRLFSGIQPTGVPHIGNYFGAISQWVELQNSGNYDDVIFSVVDMHSITLPQDPVELRANIRSMVACLLACGIDPEKSILFQQSSVSEHAELGWILGCHTTLPRLQHLPQWKEKSEKLKEVPLGIFTYPVLQSADILLYRATDVPVGDDQVKHIELARHLAKVFNNKYGFVFPRPKCLVGDFQRIRSLRNPTSKMSKSEADPRGRIDLTDSPDDIQEKCRKAVSDMTSEVTYDLIERPGVSNLVDIYAAFSKMTPEEVCQEAKDMDTLKFKEVVAEVIVNKLEPIQTEYNRIMSDKGYVDHILESGAKRARAIATPVCHHVKHLIGFH